MDPNDEQAFRDLLDDDGLLRSEVGSLLELGDAFAVFAQRSDAALDLASLRRQGERFFGVKLGLTADKRYGVRTPEADAARIVVASPDATASGTRLCYGRRTEERDLIAAEEAERLEGTTGMALLARRCPMVWLVSRESRESHDDRVALTIAAVFASTFLGPILVCGRAIFGVKTARLRLER
jgi:hypothetical protein